MESVSLSFFRLGFKTFVGACSRILATSKGVKITVVENLDPADVIIDFVETVAGRNVRFLLSKFILLNQHDKNYCRRIYLIVGINFDLKLVNLHIT